MSTTKVLSPYQLHIPGTEGWERMYPSILIFPEEKREHFERVLFFREIMHWPKVLRPFDACATVFCAQMGLNAYQHRIFVVPPSRGMYEFIVNGWCYIAEVYPPYNDPKTLEERTNEFMKRLSFVARNFDELHWKYKKTMMEILKEQYSLYDHIPDSLPEVEDISHFADVRGVTTGEKVVRLYEKALELYNLVQEGYQYMFIGMAYSADTAFSEFCKSVFPNISDQEIARMITGAELEAFRPDEEVKRLARLAVELGLASDIQEADNFDALRSKFEKSENGKKWLEEFQKSSFPWFYMIVMQGMMPYSDEDCWIENPDIIHSFLKFYIEKLEKGEKIERDVKALIREKGQLFNKYFNMLKTEEEKQRFKELHKMASKLYTAVEEQVLYVKNWNFALFRRNVKKFAELLAKCGIIKEPNDVFYLQFDEIRSALQELNWYWSTGDPPSQRWIKEIEWRKQILEKFEKWRPPVFLGPLEQRPEEPFLVLHSGIDQHWFETYQKQEQWEKFEEIKGWPASPGVVEGVSRVIHESKDIRELRPGEILVCPHTSPAWTPAFAIIKGVVVDQGGMMSHAAIVSREYGIPAVVGTLYGSTVIKTGDCIRIDGTKGKVTILKRSKS